MRTPHPIRWLRRKLKPTPKAKPITKKQVSKMYDIPVDILGPTE